MRVSIIVPVFNESKSLRATLDLLGARADTDVVIVDGGSADGTLEIARTAGFNAITSECGRAHQMNAGAAATRGEVLLFLHADTLLPEGALEQVRHAISCGACGGFFRVRLDSHRPLLRLVGRLISWRSRLSGIATGDQALFVSRAVFDRMGGFAPLPLFEDVELSRRLKRHGRVACLPGTVITSARRWEQLGPARTIVRMWLLRAAYACGVRPEHLARHYEAPR